MGEKVADTTVPLYVLVLDIFNSFTRILFGIIALHLLMWFCILAKKNLNVSYLKL